MILGFSRHEMDILHDVNTKTVPLLALDVVEENRKG